MMSTTANGNTLTIHPGQKLTVSSADVGASASVIVTKNGIEIETFALSGAGTVYAGPYSMACDVSVVTAAGAISQEVVFSPPAGLSDLIAHEAAHDAMGVSFGSTQVTVCPSTQPGAAAWKYGCTGTDDQEVINAAIAEISAAGGGVVFLVGGDYEIGDEILPESNVAIIGAGRGVTKIKVRAASTPITNSSINAIACRSVENVTIRSLTIDGNQANNVENGASLDSKGNGVYITLSSNITVDDVESMENIFHGVFVASAVGANSTIHVHDCYLHDNGYRPLHAHGEEGVATVDTLMVNNNFCYNNGNNPHLILNSGIFAVFTNTRRVIIANNQIWGESGTGLDTEGLLTGSDRGENSLVMGNIVHDCNVGVGIGLNIRNVTYANNIITDCASHGYTMGASSNLRISGGVVRGCGGAGINLPTSTASNLFIDGVEIDGCATQGIIAGGGGALTGLSIQNCNIHDCTRSGIHLNSTSINGLTLLNNSVKNNCATFTSGDAGIYVANTTRGKIHLNTSQGNGPTGTPAGTYQFELWASNTVNIQSNHWISDSKSTAALVRASDASNTGIIYNFNHHDRNGGGAAFNAFAAVNSLQRVGNTAAGSTTILPLVMRNSGSASTSAATSVVVNHGLAVTPLIGDIQITPQADVGSGVRYWVDTVTSTTFTINTSASTSVAFSWRAAAYPG